MKIKIKKLLNESNQGQDLGYTDVENVRMINGKAVNQAVLTPSDGIDHFEGEETFVSKQDTRVMTKRDYINRIRDVVKSGRKVPYLYYAYKGVDENGELMDLNDLTPVFDLQLKKAGMLATRLRHAGDASVLMFLCDFGLLMDHHREWDKRYEERMRELLPATYDQMAMKKGYDRAEFQSGRDTDLKPFSTVAIGRGSKPIFHQNVDFMYKTSPEPNKNVDPNDLWAFSIRVPLSIAYMILTGMGLPYKPKDMNDIQRQKYRQDRRTAATERRVITRKKFTDAYNHWAVKEKEYRIQYAERMMQEPNSWAAMHDNVSKLADMIKLNFNQFNSNYVETEREGDKQREKEGLKKHYGEHWTDKAGPELRFMAKLIQPNPSTTRNQSLINDLKDPEIAKRIAKTVIGAMINNPYGSFDRSYQDTDEGEMHWRNVQAGTTTLGKEAVQNIAKNLQDLVNNYKTNPTVQKNLVWIQQAIQQYYIMGGQ